MQTKSTRGGLDSRRAADMNKTLIPNTGRTLATKPDDVVTEIMLSKYGNLLESRRTVSSTASTARKRSTELSRNNYKEESQLESEMG